ncbi:MAG TPA: N-acetyl sugar amidotransferase [Flavitalea sp.]|nr:N-acetyl sugar amidotransferase [Flavitalea sp.]
MVLSANDPLYRQCTLSVMDNIADPNIHFDEKGICNYYYEYKQAEKKFVFRGKDAQARLDQLVTQLKSSGAGRKYDCMLGVSGGVDSTFLALKAKQLGLRVLCVHFDNGWDSELAVKNIENIVSRLNFDLYTYVIDWEEFKDIQLSYFKANVIDIEAVNDIAIFLALDKICAKYDLKYILDGRNIVTEQTIPYAWLNKDLGNMLNIHRKFGTRPLKTFPIIGRFKKEIHSIRKSYSSVPLLNHIEYNKKQAKKEIMKVLEWKDYGGKHYESIFTRFYQGYILPVKFHVDKRKSHLSNLIFSGQITRDEALEELEKPIYPPEQLAIDKPFVLKKLGLTEKEFQDYLESEAVDHSYYGSYNRLSEDYPILKLFVPIKRLILRR